MYFAYDADGKPMSVLYNDVTYYYVTNLQGDVVAILSNTGELVVSYTYDAWGNLLSTSGSMADTLGAENPLRYRGYVYDVETGLYYLQSRYYDPQMGRFINADGIGYLGTSRNLTSYNLFAYCGNNPVMGYDPMGEWTFSIDFSFFVVCIGGMSYTYSLVLLAPPTGGASLGALAISASTITAAGEATICIGTVIVGDAITASISEANGKRTSRNQMQKQVESKKAAVEPITIVTWTWLAGAAIMLLLKLSRLESSEFMILSRSSLPISVLIAL